MKKILLILITISTIISQLSSITIDFKKHSGITAATRSIILPGWGQYYNEQKNKTYIFAGLCFGMLGLTLFSYNQQEEAYKKYEEKGIRDSVLYKDYENWYNTTNVFGLLTILCWSINVYDAYVNGEKYKKQYWFYFKKDKICVVYRF